MKRFIFSAIALAVATSACTESGIIETPDTYSNPLVFDTYIGKSPVSKAVDSDLTYLQEGTVPGLKLYAFKSDVGNTNSDYVDYSSSYLDGELQYNNAWIYSEGDKPVDAYMPSGKDLAFASYNLAASSCIENPTSTGFDFVIEPNMANQVDLLVTPLTFVTETAGKDTPVSLHFYHLLSRIGFKILSTGGNADIKINTINVRGKFPNAGHVNMKLVTSVETKRPEIAPITNRVVEGSIYNTEGYSFFSNNQGFIISCKQCNSEKGAQQITQDDSGNHYMMIIPGKVENLLDIEDVDNDGNRTEEIIAPYIEVKYQLGTVEKIEDWDKIEEKTAKVPLAVNKGTEAAPKWENWIFEAGKAYEFIFKITTATIEFSATVVEGGWEEQPSTEHPL